MTRFLAVAALSCAAVLPAACGSQGDSAPAADVPAPAAMTAKTTANGTADDAATAPAPAAAAATTPAPPAGGEAAAPNAPTFAVLYPGARLDAPAVTASGAAGPGGMATYTTEAGPDAVIAFHRAHAESAGLSSAMAMNQGEARAYGAASPDSGASLQVVASATDTGSTSVQISWSAGK